MVFLSLISGFVTHFWFSMNGGILRYIFSSKRGRVRVVVG